MKQAISPSHGDIPSFRGARPLWWTDNLQYRNWLGDHAIDKDVRLPPVPIWKLRINPTIRTSEDQCDVLQQSFIANYGYQPSLGEFIVLEAQASTRRAPQPSWHGLYITQLAANLEALTISFFFIISTCMQLHACQLSTPVCRLSTPTCTPSILDSPTHEGGKDTLKCRRPFISKK